MLSKLRVRILEAFGTWCINRALQTPYIHLTQRDGTPYMNRYWLFRIGMPRHWRLVQEEIRTLEQLVGYNKSRGLDCSELYARIDQRWDEIAPRWAISVHHIVSSDESIYHDHPRDYISLILRDGYYEVVPPKIDVWRDQVKTTSQYNGYDPIEYGVKDATFYPAGSILFRKARDWHFLILPEGGETWSLFITGPKRQEWGFLADGMVKVPWRMFVQRRHERRAEVADAAARMP